MRTEKKVVSLTIAIFCSINFLIGQRKATLYAYKFNSFTKIPITKKTIKSDFTFKKVIKGKEFFEKLDALLLNKSVIENVDFSNKQIRIYVKSSKSDLLVSRDLYLLYKRKCYEFDEEVTQLITGYIPVNDRRLYTPFKYRKRP